MAADTDRRGARLAAIVGTAVACTLYVGVLLAAIPPSFSRIVSSYSLFLLVAVLALYYGGSRLPATYRWPALAGLTLLLCGLGLSFLWHSGYSSDKLIGGLLPFRDAFDYYNGANWILRGEAIKVLNEGAAWRPLYPGFLAADHGWDFPSYYTSPSSRDARDQMRAGLRKMREGQESIRDARDLFREAVIQDGITPDLEE